MNKNITTTLLSLLLLFFYAPLWAQFPQMGNDIDGEAAGDISGSHVSMPDANTLAIGAIFNEGNGVLAGHVRIYSWDSASRTWLQKGADIDGEAAGDRSGPVSMPDANTVAIGAQGNSGNGSFAGHVRIYSWDSASGTWLQKGADIDGEAVDDLSGSSVSMPDANTVAIGAHGNSGNGSYAGHVRIYSWDSASGTWLQKGGDIDGEAAFDNSGMSSISMPDANTVAIGAFRNDGNGIEAGHVRIYSWDSASGTWLQKGADIDGEAAGDWSGSSISMPDANTVAIGAHHNSENGFLAGHVRIYSWDSASGAWLQKGADIDGEAALDRSGSVSMPDANTVAIGAATNSGNGSEAGHVRIYRWNSASGAWLQIGADIDGEAVGDRSGPVSMPDVNTVAIGAALNDGNGHDAGHVRVYKLKGIYGYAYQDFNQNCLQNALDIGLANRTLMLNPGNILLQTGSTGSWYIDSLPIGTYTLTADTGSPIWQLTCPAIQSFTITNPDSLIFAPSFGYISNYPCTAPDVSIHAPFLRPGFSDQRVYVQACNTPIASALLDSAYIIVELDPLLTVQSGSMAYTALGNDQYSVNIGDLYPGQCVDFWLSTTLSVSAILGQTLCMNAELYPVDSCALDSIPNPYPTGTVSPCTLPWDRSSLDVEGYCVNDSVRFVIYNTGVPGGGDMDCYAPVRVYLDGLWILLDSIQLQGGDSIVFMFAGNGQTWRLEADQHPLHPGNSHPNATIENCGTGTWTPNLVNVLPMDDADPIIDIYCGLVTGSYDPNDKTGFPLGVGTTHDILPNQKLEYLVRFQNTGTDTAFTIVIRDTLSTDFNVFSVKPGVSSHNYSFRMYGPRVLEWTFNNIMLPDSNVNEPASHGFVKFEVQQNPNLPNGTLLENSAAIYFDFNAPIFTNTSRHTINNKLLLITNTQKNELERGLQILLYPNPTTGQFTLDLGGLQGSVTVTISNLMGQTLSSQTYSNQRQIGLVLEGATGMYLISIQNEKGETATLKVVKE